MNKSTLYHYTRTYTGITKVNSLMIYLFHITCIIIVIPCKVSDTLMVGLVTDCNTDSVFSRKYTQSEIAQTSTLTHFIHAIVTSLCLVQIKETCCLLTNWLHLNMLCVWAHVCVCVCVCVRARGVHFCVPLHLGTLCKFAIHSCPTTTVSLPSTAWWIS